MVGVCLFKFLDFSTACVTLFIKHIQAAVFPRTLAISQDLLIVLHYICLVFFPLFPIGLTKQFLPNFLVNLLLELFKN